MRAARRRSWRIVPAGIVALGLVATPAAARDVLAPGLVYERVVRPGPAVVHVLRLDRYPARRADPDGPLYRVEAASGDALLGGRTRLSSMVRERRADGALAGINGDFFSWTGIPSGMLLDQRGLVRNPVPYRSSVVLDHAGGLHVGVLALAGTLSLLGPEGPIGATAQINAINRMPRDGGGESILYTEAFGERTPATPGTPSLVLQPLDPAAPLIGQVTARVLATGGGGSIGLDGRLVVALGGSRAAALAQRARPGDLVTLGIGVPGLAPGAVAGVGGGPALVAEGRPVRASEGFSSAQVDARTARSAIGQTATGTLLLVSVEDGRSGGSRGMTAGELATLMADLGAVTAAGLDSGGSAGLSIRGTVPESVGSAGERAIATALVVSYRGVRLPPPEPNRVSPDGDRRAETTTAVYRLTGRSAVRATLIDARGRRVARLAAGWRGRGAHRVRVPVRQLRDGRYRVRVVARGEDDRRATRATRVVVVDRTLGHLRAAGRAGAAVVTFRLTRAARVTVRVRVPGGWRTVVSGRKMGPGRPGLRVPAPAGRRAIQVSARSHLGVTTQQTVVRVGRP